MKLSISLLYKNIENYNIINNVSVCQLKHTYYASWGHV